jgi:isochorismate synthase
MAECTLSSSDIKKNDSSLINQYVTGESAYFSSPTNAILAHPPFANLLDVGIKNLSQQVVESLRFATELGHSDPIVIGAIPFDTSKPSALRLSTGFSFEKETSAFNHTVASTYQATDIGKVSIKTVPSSNEFVGAVFNALERFSRKELDKVVLSRTLQLDSEHDVDIASVLKRLKNGNANGYTFAVPANQHEHKLCKKTLLGASPELLIKKIGNKIIANPLAGSEPKQGDIKADKLITDQLMNSKKDRYEHALVIKSIAQ